MHSFLLLLGGWLLAARLWAAPPAPTPRFLLLDPAALATYKTAYKAGHQPEAQQVKAVLTQADKALKVALYTIADKPQTPPSGDKHDYQSQAPYWWPDPSKPGGRPYVQKDGQHNPEAEAMHDSEHLSQLCGAVQNLGLAYYFTADERYAQKAAALLQAFFLDPATRMNPNLNFGQGIPGINDGRNFGIIETRHLVAVPETLALLAGSPSLRPALVSGLQAWYRTYLTWLTTSPVALPEGQAKNNHGTFYDTQVVDFALFVGDTAQARRTLRQQTWPRVAVQLAADGSQPLELARTRPWNYVSMNLQGWERLALLAPHVGLDLWHYTTPDGRGLHAATTWFRPYLLHQRQLDRTDVAPTSDRLALGDYALAATAYPDLDAPAVYQANAGFAPVPWAY